MKNSPTIPPTTPTFLTATELAALLDVSPKTVAKWRRQGEGPLMQHIVRDVINFSGKHQRVATWVAPVESLRAWLEEHRPHRLIAFEALLSGNTEG